MSKKKHKLSLQAELMAYADRLDGAADRAEYLATESRAGKLEVLGPETRARYAGVADERREAAKELRRIVERHPERKRASSLVIIEGREHPKRKPAALVKRTDLCADPNCGYCAPKVEAFSDIGGQGAEFRELTAKVAAEVQS